jgi:hypothetical protein
VSDSTIQFFDPNYGEFEFGTAKELRQFYEFGGDFVAEYCNARGWWELTRYERRRPN